MLSFFSSRRNWDSPNPSPVGECAPPPVLGGGAHSLARKRGWYLGESQFRRWDIHYGNLYIYILSRCTVGHYNFKYNVYFLLGIRFRRSVYKVYTVLFKAMRQNKIMHVLLNVNPWNKKIVWKERRKNRVETAGRGDYKSPRNQISCQFFFELHRLYNESRAFCLLLCVCVMRQTCLFSQYVDFKLI